MPFIPITDADRAEMLRRIGAASVEELFGDLPEDARYPELDLPRGSSEPEVLRELGALADANGKAGPLWFLGAGAYDHFIPSVVPALVNRSEFVTAYTPYQPEVSQGTLQAVFEYQSMVAELTGMDVVNASHYDGATALAEAAIMALRAGGGRRKLLVPAALHPEYREVLETYLAPLDAELVGYDGPPAAAVSGVEAPAALIACYPDFLGRITDLSGAAEAAHGAGALLVVQADPIMLGLFKSPGAWGADIVVGEGQSLGNPLSFGGPYLGIMATTSALVRRLPGRIVGEARDAAGRRGFALTLVAREQHIRREKAVSNICSNQGLATLTACVYLAAMGKTGLRRVAELCWHRAHYAAKRIAGIPGYTVADGPFFKEFVVRTPVDAEELSRRLFEKGAVPGFPLSRYYPERRNELLVCVTEKNSRTDIDELATLLGEAAV